MTMGRAVHPAHTEHRGPVHGRQTRATIRQMSNRRGSPSTHVRPRPPSSGRPAPVKARPRAPSPGRLAVHTPMRRSRGIPLVARMLLVATVVAVAVGVLYVAVGGAGRVVASLSSTVTGFIDGVTATPSPSPSPLIISDAPTIESASEPYTKSDTVDLVVTVPAAVSGDPDSRLRVYLALEGQTSAPIKDVPLAAVPRNIIPVTLTKGINDFMVTVVGPGGESEPSAVVRYVLDQTKPSLKVTSPESGSIVNAQGREDRRQDPGPIDGQRAQHHDRRLDHRHRRCGRRLPGQPAAGHRQQRDPADIHRPGRQRQDRQAQLSARVRQAHRLAGELHVSHQARESARRTCA